MVSMCVCVYWVICLGITLSVAVTGIIFTSVLSWRQMLDPADTDLPVSD